MIKMPTKQISRDPEAARWAECISNGGITMVYITGDIHGSAEPLYDLFDRFQPTEDDIIVLLGDVGVNYTGRMRDCLLKQELCDMKSTFFCIHGNHENRPQNTCSYQEKQ